MFENCHGIQYLKTQCDAQEGRTPQVCSPLSPHPLYLFTEISDVNFCCFLRCLFCLESFICLVAGHLTQRTMLSQRRLRRATPWEAPGATRATWSQKIVPVRIPPLLLRLLSIFSFRSYLFNFAFYFACCWIHLDKSTVTFSFTLVFCISLNLALIYHILISQFSVSKIKAEASTVSD